MPPTSVPLPITADDDIAVNATSFLRSLRASNRRPKTQITYMQAIDQLARYLEGQGMPLDVAHVKREHVEAFISHLIETRSPGTAANRYRSLQQFFKWMVEEGEIKDSPMVKMHPPKVDEIPPDVLRDDQLTALLRTCETGKTFDDRRDTAILRVFIDSGCRLNEIASLRYNPADDEQNDVDLDQGLLRVMGKGRRERMLVILTKSIKAMDRYLRERAKHPQAHLDALWLGRKGALGDSGIFQLIKRRAREAGIGDVHPHQLRHTFAHRWLKDGGQEHDLMRLAGWKSRQMVGRYGASAANERAHDAARRRGLGDKL